MKLIIGESATSHMERLQYNGVIGLFFKNTLGGIISYIIFALFIFLAIVGLITMLKWVFKRKK